ncbi:Noranthrone monooxygenase [Penicillium rolfsii]|nr:Noranthrone monooxygenase [Penicillium rolfsii]
MASYPFGFRLAQAVGISGAAWLSGNIAALSMNATPSLLRSRREDNVPPATLVKQWRNMYENGKTQNPPVAAAVAASFFYLAWSVRSGAPLFRQTAYSRSGLFSAAAVLTIGIVPYTFLTMSSTNNALLEKASSAPEISDTETSTLIEKWTQLNMVRGYLPLIGAVVGLVASFV